MQLTALRKKAEECAARAEARPAADGERGAALLLVLALAAGAALGERPCFSAGRSRRP